jgi:hypothetical protein
MSTMERIWVAIVILLIIVGILVMRGRKSGRERANRQLVSDRQQAATLRVAARDMSLDARDSEASAAGTAAKTEQAEIDAERLRIQLEERRSAAAAQTEESWRVRHHAHSLDPDVEEKQSEVLRVEPQRGTGT